MRGAKHEEVMERLECRTVEDRELDLGGNGDTPKLLCREITR